MRFITSLDRVSILAYETMLRTPAEGAFFAPVLYSGREGGNLHQIPKRERPMPSGTHYVIERSSFGLVTIRASDSDEPIAGFCTLRVALEHVKKLNPQDTPEITPSLIRSDAA